MGKYVEVRDRLIAEAADSERGLLESLKWATADQVPGLAAQLAIVREEKVASKALPSSQFECAFHRGPDGKPVAFTFSGPGRALVETSGYFSYDDDGEAESELRFRERPSYLVACRDCARGLKIGENLADTSEPPDNLSQLQSERDQLRAANESLERLLADSTATVESLEDHVDMLEEEVRTLTGARGIESEKAMRLEAEVSQLTVDLSDERERVQGLNERLERLFFGDEGATRGDLIL